MVRRVYPVTDLVVAPPDDTSPVVDAAKTDKTEQSRPTRESWLIEVIQKTIEPASWAAIDGPGTISYFPMAGALVVMQTSAIHERIAGLLAAFRLLRDEGIRAAQMTLTKPHYLEHLPQYIPPAPPPPLPAELGTQQPIGGFPPACGQEILTAAAAVGAPMCGTEPFRVRRTEVRFIEPAGMRITWYAAQADGKPGFNPTYLEAPARYNFAQGSIYRLKLSDIPNHPGLELSPTLEVVPTNPHTATFLAHSAVPLTFTAEDFSHVASGSSVVKVVYLPDPQNRDSAPGTADTIVSSQLEPGVDPIVEAQRRGSILLVQRMGNIDPEAQKVPALYMPPGLAYRAAASPILIPPPAIACPLPNGGAPIVTGLTLPAPRCLEQPPQYTPPQPSYPLPHEMECPPPEHCVPPPDYALPPPYITVVQPPASVPDNRAQGRQASVLAELLKAYDEACAEGKTAEAKKYARAALLIDPTCFSKKR
jgi:hypothetical protein